MFSSFSERDAFDTLFDHAPDKLNVVKKVGERYLGEVREMRNRQNMTKSPIAATCKLFAETGLTAISLQMQGFSPSASMLRFFSLDALSSPFLLLSE